MERRLSMRIHARIPAIVETSRVGATFVSIHDLSLGGAFICTNQLLWPINGTLQIRFHFPTDPDAREFDLNAFVLRCTPEGIAIAFWGVGRADIRALSDRLLLASSINPNVESTG